MKKYALIVAGGSGLRMGSEVPKQFLLLKGKPILIHTIERFYETGVFDEIILVLPKSERIFWDRLASDHGLKVPHLVIDGGSSRFESVKNGLSAIAGDGYVAIHDGVRPLVRSALINRCMTALKEHSNAIPCIEIIDSIRRVNNGDSSVVDRSELRAIQTPQCFQLDLIRNAYQLSDDGKSTDDASVFERAGHKIHLVEGERTNIKITVAADLIIAAAL